ncbi:Tum protein [Rosenbergiella epipactidis]|uniref:Tum protein n=1 Tax=Rosenbergiella epipactidis TaxID=1544694 RepID=UPI001BDA5396|nr:Tum protein [Rosenbergiella epipactidis]MBT0719448.1 Tum protein [Rosenbergiella epipactidis]
MGSELEEVVRLERVELIARLASIGAIKEKDREIALNIIAEIAGDSVIKSKDFSIIFTPSSGN